MSLMVATASSTGLVMSVSTASGLAPGNWVFTTTIGKSRAGSRSTPSFVQETRPTTSRAPITISMNSGRLMAVEVSHIGGVAPCLRRTCVAAPRREPGVENQEGSWTSAREGLLLSREDFLFPVVHVVARSVTCERLAAPRTEPPGARYAAELVFRSPGPQRRRTSAVVVV